jgi:hypothetical protein
MGEALPIDDSIGALDSRSHALVLHELRALARGGVRARLSLDAARNEDVTQTPGDAWWVQIGPWGTRVEPPRSEGAVTATMATAKMADRLERYVDMADLAAAAQLAPHVISEIVRNRIDPSVYPVLPSAPYPGIASDASELGKGQPLGFVLAVFSFALAYLAMRRAASTTHRATPDTRTAQTVVSADAA